MRTYGPGHSGPDSHSFAADSLVLAQAHAAGEYVPSVVVLAGGGVGDAAVRAVLYDADGNLLGEGSPVSVLANSPAAWTTFPLWTTTPGGVAVPDDDDIYFGLHVGNAPLVVHGTNDGDGFSGTDAWADGAPASLPALSAALSPSWYAPHVGLWDPPAGVEGPWYARLPFVEAQRYLGSMGPATPGVRAVCGWHSRGIDPEEGSFAVVRKDGPLADLVGDRLAVRCGQRTVYVYVDRLADVIEDISLTRRAFMALGLLSAYELDVQVRVLA